MNIPNTAPPPTREYEVCPAFGWEIAGCNSSIIRRALRDCNLKNELPLYFRKMHELVAPYPVKVIGPAENVDKFEAIMRDHGYDDRECS